MTFVKLSIAAVDRLKNGESKTSVSRDLGVKFRSKLHHTVNRIKVIDTKRILISGYKKPNGRNLGVRSRSIYDSQTQEMKACNGSNSSHSSRNNDTNKSTTRNEAIVKLKRLSIGQIREYSSRSAGRHTRSSPIVRDGKFVEDNKELVSARHCTMRSLSVIKETDIGRLVWAKVGHSKHWPAVIVNHEECGMVTPDPHVAYVFWFGDNRVSQAPLIKMYDFPSNYPTFFVKDDTLNYKSAIKDCLRECCRLGNINHVDRTSYESLLKFANQGFYNPKGNLNPFLPDHNYTHSIHIKRCLSRIRRAHMRDYMASPDVNLCNENQEWRQKVDIWRKVHNGEVNIETICIACDRINCEVIAKHPLIQGGLCVYCKDEVEDSILSDGDDGMNMYCCLCGSPGEIILCDDYPCTRVFCYSCIRLMVGPRTVNKIEKTNPWSCFLCNPYNTISHGLIKPRKVKDNNSFPAELSPTIDDVLTTSDISALSPDVATFPKRPLRVISLFDGIATGLYVLDELGIKVDKYFSSEIDEDAKNVARLNFGDRLTHIGRVENINYAKIEEMCPIDLLIGGSPCNDLSRVNPNRKGLFDVHGTGILFYDYYRILKEITICNLKKDSTHLFWLYENVSSMDKNYKDHISIMFQTSPIIIDAIDFTPQSRPRYFWGNIPGMGRKILKKQQIKLSNYLIKEFNREACVDRINCVTTNPSSLMLNNGTKYPIKMRQQNDVPMVTELEKIFGFPSHYTDVGNLGIKERRALLAKAWSVPVIIHILSTITKYYQPLQEKQEEKNSCKKNKEKKMVRNNNIHKKGATNNNVKNIKSKRNITLKNKQEINNKAMKMFHKHISNFRRNKSKRNRIKVLLKNRKPKTSASSRLAIFKNKRREKINKCSNNLKVLPVETLGYNKNGNNGNNGDVAPESISSLWSEMEGDHLPRNILSLWEGIGDYGQQGNVISLPTTVNSFVPDTSVINEGIDSKENRLELCRNVKHRRKFKNNITLNNSGDQGSVTGHVAIPTILHTVTSNVLLETDFSSGDDSSEEHFPIAETAQVKKTLMSNLEDARSTLIEPAQYQSVKDYRNISNGQSTIYSNFNILENTPRESNSVKKDKRKLSLVKKRIDDGISQKNVVLASRLRPINHLIGKYLIL